MRSSLLKNKIWIVPYFIDPCVPLVMRRAQERNFKFSIDKMQFSVSGSALTDRHFAKCETNCRGKKLMCPSRHVGERPFFCAHRNAQEAFSHACKLARKYLDQFTARVRCLSASRIVIGLDNWADYIIDLSVWFVSKHPHMLWHQRSQLSVNISTKRTLKCAWQKGLSTWVIKNS